MVFDIIKTKFKINEKVRNELHILCKTTGHIYMLECTNEAVDLLLQTVKDGNLRARSLPSFPTGSIYMQLKMSKQKYDEFIDVCRNILHEGKSDCIRTALALWAAKNKNNIQDLEITSPRDSKLNKVKSFKIGQILFNELKSICGHKGKTIGECIRDAMLLWIESPSIQKPLNYTKILSFKTSTEEYERFRIKCLNNGYDNVSECIRDAIKMWIENVGSVSNEKS